MIWLKKKNPLYEDYPEIDISDESYANDSNAQDIFRQFIKNVPESSTIDINYTLPDVPIKNITSTYSMTLPVKFNQPVWIQDLPHGEEMAFPWLFPSGKNGITADRKPVTVCQYFHYRLYNKDPRWRQDITYVRSKSFRAI